MELDRARQTATETGFETGGSAAHEATRLRELTPRQWKSGTAAWLGWLFDGLELHLYTLIATPLVVQLLKYHRRQTQR